MKTISLHALCALLALGGGVAGAAPTVAELEGLYTLQRVRETAAELRLSADGRFTYGIAYGAQQQSAEGVWRVEDGRIVLVSDVRPEPRFEWGAPVNDRFEGDPERPVDLVVRVESPELGMTWRNIEITAQYAQGAPRTGLTGSGGLLAFEMREQGEWAGARPERIGVSYPKMQVSQQWFDVPKGTKTAHILFLPGRLIPSAFVEVRFRIDTAASAPISLVSVRENGQDGWRFERSD